MAKKLSITLPEWLIREHIEVFKAPNRSELLQELIYLGSMAKAKMEKIKNAVDEFLAHHFQFFSSLAISGHASGVYSVDFLLNTLCCIGLTKIILGELLILFRGY